MDQAVETVYWTCDIAKVMAAPLPVVLLCDVTDPANRPLTQLPPTEADIRRVNAYGGAAREIFFRRRALLRHLIAQRLGCAVEAVVVASDPAGAPQLVSPRQRPEIFLSVSGRGGLAAFAMASSRIGIDLEIVEPQAEMPLAMLHQSEVAHLAGPDPAARAAKFLQMWTLKEAYLKALGLGLAREPAEIKVAFGGDAIRLFDCDVPVQVRACQSHDARFGGDRIIAACVVL